MSYIVYRTENVVNNKFYYGVHKTEDNTKFDGYLGSGKLLNKAINKYGEENFIRRTIMEFDNKEDAFELEKLIVDEDFVTRDDCYNLTLGGNGGWMHMDYKKDHKGFKGKKHTEEWKRNMSDIAKKRKRKPHSEETKAKIRAATKGINKGNKHRLGKTHTEATKQLISKRMKGE